MMTTCTRLVYGALIFACVCLASAPMTAGQNPPAPVRTIDKGAQSNVDSARQAVARTPAEWSALWKAHNFDKPAPKVDFDREMVVAIFMGSRPSAGFSVEILSATERDGSLVVGYRESVPRMDAITAQVITAPYHIVGVPLSGGTVVFEKK